MNFKRALALMLMTIFLSAAMNAQALEIKFSGQVKNRGTTRDLTWGRQGELYSNFKGGNVFGFNNLRLNRQQNNPLNQSVQPYGSDAGIAGQNLRGRSAANSHGGIGAGTNNEGSASFWDTRALVGMQAIVSENLKGVFLFQFGQYDWGSYATSVGTNNEPFLVNNAYIQHWMIACDKGLLEQTIAISGLATTNTDVLLRLEFINGTSQSVLLTPSKNTFDVPAEASSFQIIATYTWLGITHILQGLDHLLFVFALLLIVASKRQLLWTITAFTLAHSITLAGATLGLVYVPQQPVEAVIALSILFLAMEIIHTKRGRPGAASRWPWLVAFIFGLLHGFGFAGALAEVGLPQQAIPIALIFFNVGVEIGQLFFVSIVLLTGWALHRLKQPVLVARGETAAIYVIGGLSSFWLFERISSF